MARGIIDTPDDIRRYLMTKTMRGGDAQVMVTKMGNYIEVLHAQILAMHSNMMSLAKIPKSGARQSGKSRATVELSKKEHVMKGMIDRGLEEFVWRKKAFFLKQGWHLYSATRYDSFCQMFMGWAKLRDLKPEMYGGEEVLWNRFVVPIVSQIMQAKRSNLYRRVHDWWGSKCSFLVVYQLLVRFSLSSTNYLALFFFQSTKIYELEQVSPNGHKVISSANQEWLNACIESCDVDSFIDQMRDPSRPAYHFYMSILHQCVIVTMKEDGRDVMKLLSHQEGDRRRSVYDITSALDEAYIWLLIENNHEGWTRKYNDGGLKKKNLGKWTTRQDRKGNASYGSSGWEEDGIIFFNKARHFFSKVRTHKDFLAVKASALAFQVEMCKADNYQGGKKRKRAGAMDEEFQVPSFLEWEEI
jgi:hypothetical protein